MTKIQNIIILMTFTILGAYLRFNNLGYNPLWIDEVLLMHKFVGIDRLCQSIPYVGILHIINWFTNLNEFWIRFPSALAGTLTIPALYLVLKNKTYALLVSGFVAVLPLMVFWSTVAVPYALAGLFMILGWRWFVFNILGVLTTPIAVIGFKLRRDGIIIGFVQYCIIIVCVASLMGLRGDLDRDFLTWDFLWTAKRMWYLFIITIFMYGDSLLNYLGRIEHD